MGRKGKLYVVLYIIKGTPCRRHMMLIYNKRLPMCNTSISSRWIKGGNEAFLHKGR